MIMVHVMIPVNLNSAPISEEFTDDIFMEPSKKLSVTGHYKNLFQYFHTRQVLDSDLSSDFQTHSKTLTADLNRVRLSPEYQLSSQAMIHGDVDFDIIFSNYPKSRTFAIWWQPWQYNELWRGIDQGWISEDTFYRFHLHRFYAKIISGPFTITLGRQLIRFGSGRLWNPLDILNPIPPALMEGPEDQNGTNAIRVEYYPGPSTEISLAYVPKREMDCLNLKVLANANTNLVSRIKTTLADTDLAVLVGRVTRRNLAGVDVSAIAYDGLFRAAMLAVFPDGIKNYLLINAGYEYTFASGLYLLAEFFFNGNALNSNPDLLQAWQEYTISGMNEERYIYLANQFLTMNRHYGGLVLAKEITPLITAECFFIWDMDGQAVYASPSVGWNLFQNLDLRLALMGSLAFGHASMDSDFEQFQDHPLLFFTATWYF